MQLGVASRRGVDAFEAAHRHTGPGSEVAWPPQADLRRVAVGLPDADEKNMFGGATNFDDTPVDAALDLVRKPFASLGADEVAAWFDLWFRDSMAQQPGSKVSEGWLGG